jgi:site-specific recombinase XerD
MGIYKKGNRYWMIKQFNGNKVERSLDTSIKRVAEIRYAKIVSEIIDGAYFNNQIRKRTLKEMIDRYQAEYTNHRTYYCRARDKTTFKFLYKFFLRDKLTVEKKLSLEELSDLAGHITLQDVENEIGSYEQWRKTKNIKPGTILKDLGLLRRMFNIARKQWKWKINNPISDIELPKVRNERVRYLEHVENVNLFNALEKAEEPWIRPFVIIAIDTGLRLNNLCELMRTEVDLLNKSIRKASEVMKNDEHLGIPLTERAYHTLKELFRVPCVTGHVFHDNGKPLYDRQVQRVFKKVLKEAGITNFHIHDLRHTFASYLRQAGVDLHTIGTLLGHKDLRMTKRYAHLNVESLRNAVNRLESTTILLQQRRVASAQSS